MRLLPQAAELAEYSSKIAVLEEAKREKEEEAESWHNKVSFRHMTIRMYGLLGGAGITWEMSEHKYFVIVSVGCHLGVLCHMDNFFFFIICVLSLLSHFFLSQKDI